MIGPHSEVKGPNEMPGRIMVNFETPDVKGEFDRLRALGATVQQEPYQPGPAGGEMWLATLADPDGMPGAVVIQVGTLHECGGKRLLGDELERVVATAMLVPSSSRSLPWCASSPSRSWATTLRPSSRGRRLNRRKLSFAHPLRPLAVENSPSDSPPSECSAHGAATCGQH